MITESVSLERTILFSSKCTVIYKNKLDLNTAIILTRQKNNYPLPEYAPDY